MPEEPPTTTTTKGKKNSRVSTTSRKSISKALEQTENQVNQYENANLLINFDFNEPLYLPLPPPLESVLKPSDIIQQRDNIEPIPITKEAMYK